MREITENRENLPLEDVLAKLIEDRKALFEGRLDLVETVVTEGLHHPEIFDPIRAVVMVEIKKFSDENYESWRKQGAIRDVGGDHFSPTW